jgi:hypothetical protein
MESVAIVAVGRDVRLYASLGHPRAERGFCLDALAFIADGSVWRLEPDGCPGFLLLGPAGFASLRAGDPRNALVVCRP